MNEIGKKIFISILTITFFLGLLIIFIGLYNEIIFIIFSILYIINILGLIYFLKTIGNKKVMFILQIIFSIIFCFGGIWLAFMGIAFGALYETPEGIVVTMLFSYLLYYLLFWFYFLFYKVQDNYKKLLLLIILNVFGTIGIFYFIIFFFYRSYFMIV